MQRLRATRVCRRGHRHRPYRSTGSRARRCWSGARPSMMSVPWTKGSSCTTRTLTGVIGCAITRLGGAAGAEAQVVHHLGGSAAPKDTVAQAYRASFYRYCDLYGLWGLKASRADRPFPAPAVSGAPLMRVLLDCRMASWSGIGRYTTGLARALAARDDVELVQVCAAGEIPPVAPGPSVRSCDRGGASLRPTRSVGARAPRPRGEAGHSCTARTSRRRRRYAGRSS